eukprot:938734-Pelagomonas_calceolata.AAC.1
MVGLCRQLKATCTHDPKSFGHMCHEAVNLHGQSKMKQFLVYKTICLPDPYTCQKKLKSASVHGNRMRARSLRLQKKLKSTSLRPVWPPLEPPLRRAQPSLSNPTY